MLPAFKGLLMKPPVSLTGGFIYFRHHPDGRLRVKNHLFHRLHGQGEYAML